MDHSSRTQRNQNSFKVNNQKLLTPISVIHGLLDYELIICIWPSVEICC